MELEVLRLDLGTIDTGDFLGVGMPVFGFVVRHPQGLVLVDTGIGGLPQPYFPPAWRTWARSVASALADHGIEPGEITYRVQTHLHTDHYGENLSFPHIPVFVQALELERARNEERLRERFDFEGAQFELLSGDAEIIPGIHAIFTPGHTVGHQSLLVESETPQLIVGDAVYSLEMWNGTLELTDEVRRLAIRGPYEDWTASLERLHALVADRDARAHFSHDVRTVDASAR